jgi:hypothetical protein
MRSRPWLAAVAWLAAATSHAAPLVHQRTIVSPSGRAATCSAVVAVGAVVVVGARGDAPRRWFPARRGCRPVVGAVRALVPSAPLEAGARFGHAVACAGIVAVAAPQPASPAARAGTVLLFDASGARRGPVAAAPNVGAQLGASLAMADGRLVVGSPLAASGEGLVYLVDPETGATVGTLESPSAAPYDLFGAAVAAGAGRIAVAEPLDDDGAANAGAVHVSTRRAGSC